MSEDFETEELSSEFDEIASIIAQEGLGYAVADYMSGNDINNEELRKLWIQARKNLHAIRALLQPYLDKYE